MLFRSSLQSSLLVLICLLSWCGLGACRACHDKAKFTYKRFSYASPIAFLVLEVYRFVFHREVLPLSIWFYPPLLDYDVSLNLIVELVFTILTRPRSSKTESGCKRYARFRIAVSAVFSGPEIPAPESSGPSTGISGTYFHLSFFG